MTKRIRGAVKAEREYRKLVRLVDQLARDPKADVLLLASARRAITDYEALPEQFR